jgi:hypothetical protein
MAKGRRNEVFTHYEDQRPSGLVLPDMARSVAALVVEPLVRFNRNADREVRKMLKNISGDVPRRRGQ